MDKILSLATSADCRAIDFSYPHSRGLYHTGAEYKPADDLFDKNTLDGGVLRLDLPLFVILPGRDRTSRLAELLSISTDAVAGLAGFRLTYKNGSLIHRRELSDSAYDPENLYGGDAAARMLTESGNADSIVLKIFCGNISAIFTGDADLKAEQALLSYYGASQLDCDLYKVGHHGSNTSTGVDFLEAMSPELALISSGKGNSYGHPHGDVLASLEAAGAKILRVDLLGEILLETDGIEIWQK